MHGINIQFQTLLLRKDIAALNLPPLKSCTTEGVVEDHMDVHRTVTATTSRLPLPAGPSHPMVGINVMAALLQLLHPPLRRPCHDKLTDRLCHRCSCFRYTSASWAAQHQVCGVDQSLVLQGSTQVVGLGT